MFWLKSEAIHVQGLKLITVIMWIARDCPLKVHLQKMSQNTWEMGQLLEAERGCHVLRGEDLGGCSSAGLDDGAVNWPPLQAALLGPEARCS